MKLKIDDFIKFSFLSEVEVSPDGKNLAYVLKKANLDDNDYDSYIYIYNLETQKNYKLTSFSKENYFKWLDNENIIFENLRTKEEKEKNDNNLPFTNLYKINIYGGEADKFLEFYLDINDIEILNDGYYIFANYDHFIKDVYNLKEKEFDKLKEKIKDEEDYIVFDEIPFWYDGIGITNKIRTILYYYNNKKGKYKKLTNEFLDIYSYSYVDKYNIIIYTGEIFKNKSKARNSVFLYDIKNDKNYKILDDEKLRVDFVKFINDKILISASDIRKYGIDSNCRFYTLGIEKFLKNREKIEEYSCYSYEDYMNKKSLYNFDELINISPDFDYSIGVSGVASDVTLGEGNIYKVYKNYLYFVFLNRIYEGIARINIDNEYAKIEVVYQSNGSIAGFDIFEDKIYAILQISQKLQELYEIKLNPKKLERLTSKQIKEINEKDFIQDNKNIKRLTYHNKKNNTIKPNYFTFYSNDDELDAFIMIPKESKFEKKRVIFNIHGGPKYAYSDIYYHEMQHWVNEGYYVIFCNPHGSDGRGDEFADMKNNYAKIDYVDFLNFIDFIKKNEICGVSLFDADFGITGGSYGGYMTNWFISKNPDLFKVAVSQRSISNWISGFNLSDIDYFSTPDTFGVDIWSEKGIEILWDASPLKFANNVKTPTLFIHSEEDYRCNLTDGLQMFHALKYHNVKSKIVIFKYENHSLSRSGKPKHRIRRLKEIFNWFNENF